jgi:cytochrome b561
VSAAPETERYAPLLRWLHWITAALVAALFALGLWIAYFAPAGEAFRHRLYNLHESTGVVVLALVLARITARHLCGAPPLPAGMPPLLRRAASVNHAVLYAALLVQPILGFLDANAAGAPLTWYEVLPLPSPLGRQPKPLADGLAAAHWWGAAVLAAAIGLHLAGAAYHGLVRRDGILRRMG